jgi:hypothetical protein
VDKQTNSGEIKSRDFEFHDEDENFGLYGEDIYEDYSGSYSDYSDSYNGYYDDYEEYDYSAR